MLGAAVVDDILVLILLSVAVGREADGGIDGVGMVPRGEVGVVVASIGAAEGVVDAELFAIVVGMAVLTTLAAPFAPRRLTAPGRAMRRPQSPE